MGENRSVNLVYIYIYLWAFFIHFKNMSRNSRIFLFLLVEIEYKLFINAIWIQFWPAMNRHLGHENCHKIWSRLFLLWFIVFISFYLLGEKGQEKKRKRERKRWRKRGETFKEGERRPTSEGEGWGEREREGEKKRRGETKRGWKRSA